MKKNLLIILLVGLGITALLFQLPKGNVAGKVQNTPRGALTETREAKRRKKSQRKRSMLPL